MTNLTDKQRQELLRELPKLRRFCMSLTADPSDSDDLLQITVERLLTKGMPSDAHVAKWSHRVCRNLWIDEIRSREVRSRYLKSEASATHKPSSLSDNNVHLDRVSVEMDKLPVDQRVALVKVAIEGCSYAEAAGILGVPIGTIMSRVARARKALADKVGWRDQKKA